MKKGILIVAGHGGSPFDPGAVGNGKKEADLTRSFAKSLYNHYKAYGVDAVLYDQSKDMYKETQAGRGACTNQGYTNVIETHLNAASADAHGTEVLLASGSKPDSIDNGILDALNDSFTNRGFKYRNDLLNMGVYASSPCSYRLIEICFISSKSDMDIYNKTADAIALNIVKKTYAALGGKAPVTVGPAVKFKMYYCKPKTGLPFYIYESSYDAKGQLVRNQFDSDYNKAGKLLSYSADTPIQAFPAEISGYRQFTIVNTTYKYKDLYMKQPIQGEYFSKGDTVMVKYMGDI
jgi:hypothetical protein